MSYSELSWQRLESVFECFNVTIIYKFLIKLFCSRYDRIFVYDTFGKKFKIEHKMSATILDIGDPHLVLLSMFKYVR